MFSRTKLLHLLMRTLLCEEEPPLQGLLTLVINLKKKLPFQGSFCVTNGFLYAGKLKAHLCYHFAAKMGISDYTFLYVKFFLLYFCLSLVF